MAREIKAPIMLNVSITKAPIMLNVSITDQIPYENKLT